LQKASLQLSSILTCKHVLDDITETFAELKTIKSEAEEHRTIVYFDVIFENIRCCLNGQDVVNDELAIGSEQISFLVQRFDQDEQVKIETIDDAQVRT
jgi:uncharacterized protein (DUF885 family)